MSFSWYGTASHAGGLPAPRSASTPPASRAVARSPPSGPHTCTQSHRQRARAPALPGDLLRPPGTPGRPVTPPAQRPVARTIERRHHEPAGVASLPLGGLHALLVHACGHIDGLSEALEALGHTQRRGGLVRGWSGPVLAEARSAWQSMQGSHGRIFCWPPPFRSASCPTCRARCLKDLCRVRAHKLGSQELYRGGPCLYLVRAACRA